MLSPAARRSHGFSVKSMDGCLVSKELRDALHDNTETPVPDQVAFRSDFPEWLSSRTIGA